MDHHLIPSPPQRIHAVPNNMVQGGLDILAQKRKTLVNVAPPSSMSKMRKMAGIDPVTEDETHHESYNLESVMLSRMKESYSDYDIPVSHLRIIDLVKEGKLPAKTLEKYFGNVKPDELEDILAQHTTTYQEILEEEAMEDAQQKGESGLTNRSLSGRTFGTSRTTNRSFGGTKRNIHEDTLLVRDTPLPSHPSLRRIEYVPSNIAVSGLPPPNPDASAATQRAPFSKRNNASSFSSTAPAGSLLSQTRGSNRGSRPTTANSGNGGEGGVVERSFNPSGTTGENEEIIDNNNNNNNYTRQTDLNRTRAYTLRPSTGRQRYDFDPRRIQRDYESTFLAKYAVRKMPGNTDKAAEMLNGGIKRRSRKIEGEAHEFSGTWRSVEERGRNRPKTREFEMEGKEEGDDDIEENGASSPAAVKTRSFTMKGTDTEGGGERKEGEGEEKIEEGSGYVPTVDPNGQAALSSTSGSPQATYKSRTRTGGGSGGTGTGSGAGTGVQENNTATRHTRRPLDGFLTTVVPLSQTKKKKIFADETNNSFGLFLQIGEKARRASAAQSLRPSSASKQPRSSAGQRGVGSAGAEGGKGKGTDRERMVAPTEVAREVIRAEEQKRKRMNERKEQELALIGGSNAANAAGGGGAGGEGEVEVTANPSSNDITNASKAGIFNTYQLRGAATSAVAAASGGGSTSGGVKEEDEENLLLHGELDEDELDEAGAGWQGDNILDFTGPCGGLNSRATRSVSSGKTSGENTWKGSRAAGSDLLMGMTQAGRREQRRKQRNMAASLGGGGTGALLYRAPSYLNYKGPSSAAKANAASAAAAAAAEQEIKAEGGKQAEAKKEDPLADVHPHLKMSVHGISFKEAPSMITQQLTQFSEGMVQTLKNRKRV